MSKKRIVKLVAVGAAIPALVLGTSTAAFADGSVTWHDTKTGRCLVTWNTTGAESWVSTALACFDPIGHTNSGWTDSQSNLVNSNGAWTEKDSRGKCLTAYLQGQVYMENCASPANYYEQWYENGLGNGHWQLVNRETGQCLDSNGSGNVYTLPCNGGQYQVWE